MGPAPYESGQEDWRDYDEGGEGLEFPGRPRRRWLTRASALLFAVLLGVVGFYAGVRVEKGQVSGSSGSGTGGGLAPLLAARASGGTVGAGAASSARARGFAGRAAFAGGFGGGTFGTVSSINGDALYLTEASGNVVKVTLSAATRVTKSQSVSKSAIRPGDAVVVQGIGSNGTIAASSISDSGARTTGTAAADTAGSGGSASSAVNSLFGGGG